MVKYYATEDQAKSVALRFLIHYLGDIHQPLHCATRVDYSYPDGDKGGNLFHLKSSQGVSNLHALWDSAIYQFSERRSSVSIKYNKYSHLMNMIGVNLVTLPSH